MEAKGRKLLAILSCLTIIGLLVAGCAPAAAPTPTPKPTAPTPTTAPPPEQPKYGGTLTALHDLGDPSDLDSLAQTSIMAQYLIGPAYSTLLQYDPLETDKLVGDLAEKWEISSDGKAITFYLQKGVKWHDGKPFTSEDVKYTINRMIDLKDPYATVIQQKRGPLPIITKIETPDATTVKLTLERPSNLLMSYLALPPLSIVPKHVYDEKGDMKKTVVGTGPFKFKEYDRGVSFKLEKNPDYFVKGRPYLDGITFHLIKDKTTFLAAFKTKKLLILPAVYALEPPHVKMLKKDVPEVLFTSLNPTLHGAFSFNNTKPPFNDVRLRQAVSLALDRQAAIDILAKGPEFAMVGSFLLAPYGTPAEELKDLPGYRQPKDKDIAEAKKLLAEAGFPNGLTTSTLTRGAYPLYEDVAIFAKEQLSKAGITVKIDAQESAVFVQRRGAGDYESYSGIQGGWPVDPLNAYRYWGRGGDALFDDEKAFKLADEVDMALDPQVRLAKARELDKRLLEQVPYVVVYWKLSPLAYWPEVRNYKGSSQGIWGNLRYREVWLAR